MKQALLFFLPCVLAFVIVNSQVPIGTGFGAGLGGGAGGVGGVGLGAGAGVGGAPGGVRRIPGTRVVYPYPVPGPRRQPSILGPVLSAINEENRRAFLANALSYFFLALVISNRTSFILG